jgi:cysteinyl-tRNA synthetase
MAKSLKNFITIRQAMLPPYSYTPRQLRLFFVTRAWNKVVNFDKKAMEEVFAMERTLDTFFASVASVVRSSDSQALRQAWTAEDGELNERVTATSEAVHAAFCDNFDTKAAVAALIALAKSTNQYVESAPAKKPFLLSKAAQTVTRTLRVLGLVPDGDATGWSTGAGGGGGASENALVGAFYNFRQEVRSIAKNMKADASAALLNLSDDLRDNVLPPLGLKFDDSELGWKRVDAQRAMQERVERRRLELDKLEKRKAAAEQDLAVLEKGSLPVASVLGDRAEFGSFDESGYPLTMADGKEIPKARQKTLKKAWSAQETAHKKFESKAKGDPEGLLAEARHKVRELGDAIKAFGEK